MHSASDNIQTEHGIWSTWKSIHIVALTLLQPQYYTKATERSHIVWPTPHPPGGITLTPLSHIPVFPSGH